MLAAAELPRFGLPSPRLAVAGLNPHAGEHGVIGTEDDDVLRPAIEACRARGVDVAGPVSRGHDLSARDAGRVRRGRRLLSRSGPDPVKMAAFGRAVNVTLGLPIVRTSVDHGTAFDIAGRGIADPSSLIEAIRLAARLAQEAPGRRGPRCTPFRLMKDRASREKARRDEGERKPLSTSDASRHYAD